MNHPQLSTQSLTALFVILCSPFCDYDASWRFRSRNEYPHTMQRMTLEFWELLNLTFKAGRGLCYYFLYRKISRAHGGGQVRSLQVSSCSCTLLCLSWVPWIANSAHTQHSSCLVAVHWSHTFEVEYHLFLSSLTEFGWTRFKSHDVEKDWRSQSRKSNLC